MFKKSILTMIFFLSVISKAELVPQTAQATDNQDNVAAVVSAQAAAKGTDRAIRLGFGPSMLFADGANSIGANVDLTFRTSETSPLYVGADLAYHRDSVIGIGVNLFHFLGTAIYQFEASGTLRPYIGLSAGINHNTASRRGVSLSATNFEVLLRPGMEIGLSDSIALGLEPKAGLIDDEIVFLPQANLVLGF